MTRFEAVCVHVEAGAPVAAFVGLRCLPDGPLERDELYLMKVCETCSVQHFRQVSKSLGRSSSGRHW